MRKFREWPIFTIAFTVVNILVFLVVNIINRNIYLETCLNFDSVVNKGEYWRILTSVFLHLDTRHLANNMIMLIFMGHMIETDFGHLRFSIVYLLAGLGASLTSLGYKYYSGHYSNSLGASGAIFGLDGALLAMVLFWPGYRRKIDLRRVLIAIALSLYGGFTGENIDNAAHVGGLVFGFIVATILIFISLIGRKGNRNIEY